MPKTSTTTTTITSTTHTATSATSTSAPAAAPSFKPMVTTAALAKNAPASSAMKKAAAVIRIWATDALQVSTASAAAPSAASAEVLLRALSRPRRTVTTVAATSTPSTTSITTTTTSRSTTTATSATSTASTARTTSRSTTTATFATTTTSTTVKVGPATTYKCPDGSDGLTQALYFAGDPSKYADVTCIPQAAFADYTGNVTLDNGMAGLTSIEDNAFTNFKGTLAISGSFPRLSKVGESAFEDLGNANSKVELLDTLVPNLSIIGRTAFDSFKGTVIITGNFPLLSEIESSAFWNAGNANSVVELTGTLDSKLVEIGYASFRNFMGTVAITGSFPLLSDIGERAFENAGNANSKVVLAGIESSLKRLGHSVFRGFTGTVYFPSGPFPNFAGACVRLDGPTVDVVVAPSDQIPLTHALYETGDPSKYADVTCIPQAAFADYTGNVTLDNGMAGLTSIEDKAFTNFKGTLTISGSFPRLSKVGESAFEDLGNANSKVELLDTLVPNLSMIGRTAFTSFKGTVIITGNFPLLSEIESSAFWNAGNANSVVELTGTLDSKLVRIGYASFRNFMGTVAITGSFPLLSGIDQSAFQNAGNANSSVAIDCRSSSGFTVGDAAFDSFKGTHDYTGELVSCIVDDYYAPLPALGVRPGVIVGIVLLVVGMICGGGAYWWYHNRTKDNLHLDDPAFEGTHEQDAGTPVSYFQAQLPAEGSSTVTANAATPNKQTEPIPDRGLVGTASIATAGSKKKKNRPSKKKKPSAEPSICVQKTSKGPCANVAEAGSKRCTKHTCGHPSCARSKSSKAQFCPQHTAIDAEPAEDFYTVVDNANASAGILAAAQVQDSGLYGQIEEYYYEVKKAGSLMEEAHRDLSPAELAAEMKSLESKMAEHQQKFDDLYEVRLILAEGWIDELQEVHEAILFSIGTPDAILQPNPWANSPTPIKVSEKKYMDLLIRSYKDQTPDGSEPPMQLVADSLNIIAGQLGGKSVVQLYRGPFKDAKRAMQKVMNYLPKHYDRILDYARVELILKDLTKFPELVDLISKCPDFSIVRAKNRFSPKWDSGKSAGYRDYQMIVETPAGWLVEVQVIPEEMHALKHELGHVNYVQYRGILEAARRVQIANEAEENIYG